MSELNLSESKASSASSSAASSTAGSAAIVRGFGLVTPLGASAWETFGVLCKGGRLTDRLQALPEDIALFDLVRAVGSVASVQMATRDPSVDLAERAIREACMAASVPMANLPTFLGASKGAVTLLEALSLSRVEGRPEATGLSVGLPDDAEMVVGLGPHGYLMHHLSQRCGLEPAGSYVAACASSLVALDAARRSLQSGRFKRAVVVTSESALTASFIHSYNRLGVLAPLPRDAYQPMPLDEQRHGFALSQLGAAVVLEWGEPEIGDLILEDTATANDCHDLIRTDPTMPALHYVASRLMSGRTMDMIHPHAPGTPGVNGHDASELAVYRDVLGDLPDLYACKGAVGHGLGSAGLVSLVLSLMCLKTGQRPPMSWLTQPIDGLPADLGQRKACAREARHGIFAAGFAGHTAGAIVRHL